MSLIQRKQKGKKGFHFPEKQLTSGGFGDILTPTTKKWTDRGAVHISTPAIRNGYSGRGKGFAAEVF